MEKRFNSKVDFWANIVLWGAIFLPIFILPFVWQTPDFWIVSLICLASSGLILWIRLATYYTITDTELIYKCGPFGGRIKIENIYYIQRKTNDIYNTGNLSSDKVAIKARRHSSINISPERKEEFISILKAMNPNIEIV